eukprot:4116187-Alexandrium_andersonii.AAC.1
MSIDRAYMRLPSARVSSRVRAKSHEAPAAGLPGAPARMLSSSQPWAHAWRLLRAFLPTGGRHESISLGS